MHSQEYKYMIFILEKQEKHGLFYFKHLRFNLCMYCSIKFSGCYLLDPDYAFVHIIFIPNDFRRSFLVFIS